MLICCRTKTGYDCFASLLETAEL